MAITCCDLLFLHWRTDNGKFHFTIYSITLKLFDMQNKDQNTDFETRSLDTSCINESKLEQNGNNIKYLIVGALFGILFIKAEVISWYRIQEMFHFQSFHMYGIIGSAVVVGAISIFIIKNSILRPSMAKIEFRQKPSIKVRLSVDSYLV
jgi:hypothetical protein